MQQIDYLKDITEIRSIMERCVALYFAERTFGRDGGSVRVAGAFVSPFDCARLPNEPARARDSLSDGRCGGSIIARSGYGSFPNHPPRRAQGARIWDAMARDYSINLLIPLVVGGLFSLILVARGMVGIIAPSMLIFYGLALVNASKYTLTDIRYLGFAEISLGLLAALLPGYSLLFWALGFGVLHIIYGTLMYYTHER